MLNLFRILVLAPMLLAAEPPAALRLLQTTSTWNGAPIHYPACAQPEVQALVIELAPGASTGWHKHPVNNYAYILEGSLRLELRDGTSQVFKAGQAFAESVDTWHRGSNLGTGPLKILVFYTGEAGVPLSIPMPATEAARD